MTNLVCKAVNAKITTDPKRMSVSGWLSAPTVDTDGEVIDGAAFDLNVHKSNPICLWMHRQNESPIGRWSDNDGNYTLRTKAAMDFSAPCSSRQRNAARRCTRSTTTRY